MSNYRYSYEDDDGNKLTFESQYDLADGLDKSVMDNTFYYTMRVLNICITSNLAHSMFCVLMQQFIDSVNAHVTRVKLNEIRLKYSDKPNQN